MPAADKKLEKQLSTEFVDPIKQTMTVLEHKIRNLEKRKRKIEGYREEQRKGATLIADQLAAVSKANEVNVTLEFAQDMCRQLTTIALETGKETKRIARKDAQERSAQELARIMEILSIQDVLSTMGTDAARDDFLTGSNGATKLTEEELQLLDDFYVEVSPKRGPEDEGFPPFPQQIASASEHLHALVSGSRKEFQASNYEVVRGVIDKVRGCGYLDKVVAVEEPAC